jgi:hypothetical protein
MRDRLLFIEFTFQSSLRAFDGRDSIRYVMKETKFSKSSSHMGLW